MPVVHVSLALVLDRGLTLVLGVRVLHEAIAETSTERHVRELADERRGVGVEGAGGVLVAFCASRRERRMKWRECRASRSRTGLSPKSMSRSSRYMGRRLPMVHIERTTSP